MGNYRFKLSDMIPNAWFYKLKKIGRSRNRNTKQPLSKKQSTSSPTSHPKKPHHLSQPRKSYYFTRPAEESPPISPTNPKFSPDPHRKSPKKKRSSRKTSSRLVTSSVSAGCSCRTSLESVRTKPDSAPEYPVLYSPESDLNDLLLPEYGSDRIIPPESFDRMISWSKKSCACRTNSTAIDDIFTEKSELAPIVTKAKVKEQGKKNSSSRRSLSNSPGVKLRLNSPKIANRRIQGTGRRSVSSSKKTVTESFAIVKSSSDPQKDFRESMVEMIVENNIRTSKDLEELLACYLTLNSDEYHDIIIKVFKQLWFDLSDKRSK